METDGRTRWERVSLTRWGQYLSRHERDAILRAEALAGEPGAALEVGVEGGRWAALLERRGWTLTCTDVDEVTLAICQERLPDATCIRVDPGDTRLPVDDASVRLLLVMEVAPVSEAPWFGAEAARVLEPGGILCLGFTNSLSVRALVYRLLRRLGLRGSPEYEGPPYSEVRASLEENGIEPVWSSGLCWGPFTRESNNPLIPLVTALEAILGLRRLVAASPFVLLIGRRSATRGGATTGRPEGATSYTRAR